MHSVGMNDHHAAAFTSTQITIMRLVTFSCSFAACRCCNKLQTQTFLHYTEVCCSVVYMTDDSLTSLTSMRIYVVLESLPGANRNMVHPETSAHAVACQLGVRLQVQLECQSLGQKINFLHSGRNIVVYT